MFDHQTAIKAQQEIYMSNCPYLLDIHISSPSIFQQLCPVQSHFHRQYNPLTSVLIFSRKTLESGML